MIVTIDGPAGAGKSSVARGLANRLGFDFLDTGAMYRAVALTALETDVDLENAEAMVRVASEIKIEFQGDRLLVDGRDVSEHIRTPRVTECVRFAAGNADLRSILVEQQRRVGETAMNLVTEGRDQGTIVFPNAECKIFLTATPEERARRRHRELVANGEVISLAEVLDSQNKRDAGDADRDVAPLAKANDAVEVYTDEMTPEQVLAHLEWVVESSK
jgi:cytidylate kinase